ncbi:D-hexose-6-phosphate mutarotase [Litorivivens lipolytica]|uniref:Putative glucose-6-phosphate 1-epimerase n=1 Tax=Litorivivens lipolytica TaxID=1524264 RepID=A0A7W4W796_9GAMM|nr:D-hexose-6-phosphate mutarotase [Litorivivens lipolytica]MBB3048729.1 D-hexose-6-phosphate mutarotase [Litorivivens lipolytica]
MSQLNDLNSRFPANSHWHFSEPAPGIVLLHIHSDTSTATISLYGGQVLSFRPRNQDDLLWVSDDAHFAEGKAIRGGIPVCWPWFGPHPTDADAPAHGTVRKTPWQLEELECNHQHAKVLLRYSDENLNLQLAITLDTRLHLALTTENHGATNATITSALHSYFAISDISDIHITGLEDKPFRDAVNSNRACLQRGVIRFNGELDRVYQDVDKAICIHDPGLKRIIRIHNTGSKSAVVWTPWIDKSKRLGDMGVNGYRQMVCVESANADSDAITLPPGGQHTLSALLSIEDL